MNARTATAIHQSRERGTATLELLVVAIALLAFTGYVGRLTWRFLRAGQRSSGNA